MADTDQASEALERLDHLDSKEAPAGFRPAILPAALSADRYRGGPVGTLLGACGSSASSSSGATAVFGSAPTYKFVFVNHVTTNSFFVPTQYGIQDACKLLGSSYEWTGSESENIDQMVNAINTAVSSGADGIAVSLISKTAFNVPIENALKAGIPVIAYNADARLPQQTPVLRGPGPEEGR